VKHAFIMNSHNDLEQAKLCIGLLRKHFPSSSLYLYYDGPGRPMGVPCDDLIWADEEPCKAASIIHALNHLIDMASLKGIDLASFLHADMIPTDAWHWYKFEQRFAESGKALTYTTMWPGHPWIDFCNLHFNLPEVTKLGLFPAHRLSFDRDFNEHHLTKSLDFNCPTWRQHTYPLWTMVHPHKEKYIGVDGPVVKIGHTADLSFTFHNFTPETSVIHTNDPVFWSNYEELLR